MTILKKNNKPKVIHKVHFVLVQVNFLKKTQHTNTYTHTIKKDEYSKKKTNKPELMNSKL